jgi:transposase-like protein
VVSEVARRHGLAPQQLFTWRRQARQPAGADATIKAPQFVPAIVETALPEGAVCRRAGPVDRIEIAQRFRLDSARRDQRRAASQGDGYGQISFACALNASRRASSSAVHFVFAFLRHVRTGQAGALTSPGTRQFPQMTPTI